MAPLVTKDSLMFLALREIRHARARFALIAAMMVLVAGLVFILSGLANGLAADNAAAIERLPADRILFQASSNLSFDRSRLDESDLATVRAVPGVTEASPLGVSMTNVAFPDNTSAGVAIFGVDPASSLAPPVTSGARLSAPGAVIDQSLAQKGVKVGDTIVAQPSGVPLKVVGITSDRTYRHAPVVYVPVETWRQIQFGANLKPGSAPISAVAVQGSGAALNNLMSTVPGTMSGTKDAVVQALPGYAQESGTLLMIQVFLLVIAAGIIAAFFYIMTLQKTAEFGVLKAIGTSMSYLTCTLVCQIVLLALAGIALGAALSFAIAQLIPASVPFLLDSGRITVFGAVMLTVALIGSLLSLIRIARVDPLTAIGHAA